MGLETFLILHRMAYRKPLKGIVQFTCLLRDKSLVGVHLDGFLNNPAGAILGGFELVVHSVEEACQLSVGDYESRSGTNPT